MTRQLDVCRVEKRLGVRPSGADPMEDDSVAVLVLTGVGVISRWMWVIGSTSKTLSQLGLMETDVSDSMEAQDYAVVSWWRNSREFPNA